MQEVIPTEARNKLYSNSYQGTRQSYHALGDDQLQSMCTSGDGLKRKVSPFSLGPFCSLKHLPIFIPGLFLSPPTL